MGGGHATAPLDETPPNEGAKLFVPPPPIRLLNEYGTIEAPPATPPLLLDDEAPWR